jgi:uncharacterized protein (TIGR02246 family)
LEGDDGVESLPWVIILAVTAVGGGSATSRPQTASSSTRPAPISMPAGIERLMSSYVEAFNRQDSDALARLYTKEARFVDERQEAIRGREAIREQLCRSFAARPGAKLSLHVKALDLVSPDTAVGTGSAIFTESDGRSHAGNLMAVLVQESNEWKIAAVQETPPPPASAPSSPLETLDWMIGHWQSSDGEVEARCHWALGHAFIHRDFSVSLSGQLTLTGTEIIGWDPVQSSIRSWYFDSRAGFGESRWTQTGPQEWKMRAIGVLPDGRRASAVHFFRRIDDHRMAWSSVDRSLGGELQPDVEEVIVHRVPDSIVDQPEPAP